MSYFRVNASGSGGGGNSLYTSTTLYKNGLQQGTINTNVSASGSASDVGSYLKVRIENVANKYAWLGIKADLTDVDFVTFYDVSVVSNSNNAQYVFVSPSLGTTSMPSGSVSQLTVGAGKTHKVILDVTSFTGEYYVGICVYSGGAGGARETQCSLIDLIKVEFP